MSGYPMSMPYGWFHISYSDELQAGQSKAVRYFDKELVLFRTESGKAVLMDAYCPHLGAHLGRGINQEAGQGGRIEGESIVCPFHAWKFNDEGKCVEIPYAKNVPPKVRNVQCLKSWPVKEINQVIFAWYHPEDAVPEYEVEPINELNNNDGWGRLEKHRWIVNTHIQEIAENSADPAHFKYVHGTATFPDTEFSFNGHKQYGVFKVKLNTPRGRVDGCIASVSNGPGQGFVRYTGICETVQLGHVTPIDNGTCEINFAFSQKKVGGKIPEGGVNQAIIMDICKQLREDKPVWENKIYRPLPVLCDGDGPIARFRRWMAQFYVDHSTCNE